MCGKGSEKNVVVKGIRGGTAGLVFRQMPDGRVFVQASDTVLVAKVGLGSSMHGFNSIFPGFEILL